MVYKEGGAWPESYPGGKTSTSPGKFERMGFDNPLPCVCVECGEVGGAKRRMSRTAQLTKYVLSPFFDENLRTSFPCVVVGNVLRLNASSCVRYRRLTLTSSRFTPPGPGPKPCLGLGNFGDLLLNGARLGLLFAPIPLSVKSY